MIYRFVTKIRKTKPNIFLNKTYLNIQTIVYICSPFAGVVELVDTLDLGFNLIISVKKNKMQAWWNW